MVLVRTLFGPCSDTLIGVFRKKNVYVSEPNSDG
jgi:hypothetical protein